MCPPVVFTPAAGALRVSRKRTRSGVPRPGDWRIPGDGFAGEVGLSGQDLMTAMTLPPPAPEEQIAEPPLRILLVDDQPCFAEGVAIVLGIEPGLEIVGVAHDGRTGVELAIALRPEIVLMDVSMPVMDGFEATRLLRARSPRTLVVMLSGSDAPEDVERAFRCGAGAYCTKDRLGELADCLRSLGRTLPVKARS